MQQMQTSLSVNAFHLQCMDVDPLSGVDLHYSYIFS